MGKQHILQNASENAPITKNAAIGILVTALSPDCRHFDLNIRIYVNKFNAFTMSFVSFLFCHFDSLVSYDYLPR